MTKEEQQIESWFKHTYNILRDRYECYFIPYEEELALSAEYKRWHQRLIDDRHAQEAAQARLDASGERACRECGGPIEAVVSRGRPPVRCVGCRGVA